MELVVNAPDIARDARPGQFCMLRILENTSDPLLRRPLSIHDVRDNNVLFLYKIAGRGTALLASLKNGDKIKVLGPLGTSFQVASGKHVIMAGGGLGVAPLFFLARTLRAMSCKITVFLGGRRLVDIPAANRFRELAPDAIIITEDGSSGMTGVVTEPLEKLLEDKDADLASDTVIVSCGPWPMMHAVHDIAIRYKTDCLVSMESHMACGAGLCLGCAVPASSGGYFHVCKDGPVTNSKKILWEQPA